MVPLCSAGRTVYRGRKPPQRYQPQHDRPWRDSDKPARAATIFTHNGAPNALVGCLGRRGLLVLHPLYTREARNPFFPRQGWSMRSCFLLC